MKRDYFVSKGDFVRYAERQGQVGPARFMAQCAYAAVLPSNRKARRDRAREMHMRINRTRPLRWTSRKRRASSCRISSTPTS